MKNSKITINVFWKMVENITVRIITFVLSIILSRLLDPTDFGTIALTNILIDILMIFLDVGFSSALIQKKEVNETDYSSVLLFSLLFSVFLYLLLFFIAPFFARFYGNNELILLIRVLGLSLIACSIKNVQYAYAARNMKFKSFFFSSSIGTIIAAIVSVALAYNGYGAWSLVAQTVIDNYIDVIIMFFILRLNFKLKISYSHLKELLKYGNKIFVSSLIENGFTGFRRLIIGKYYSTTDLAFYSKGSHYPSAITSIINNSTDAVMFPVLSSNQNDIKKIKSLTKKTIKTSLFIIAPAMIGIYVCSNQIIQLLFTDKWLPCVPYLKIFCIVSIIYPLDTANMNSIKSIGKSDIILNLTIKRSIISILMLLATKNFGPIIMTIGYLVGFIINTAICSYYTNKFINYSLIEEIKDTGMIMLVAIIMGVLVNLLNLNVESLTINLITQIITGTAIYILLIRKFENNIFYYYYDVLKNTKNKIKKWT